ncbi:MAG: homoserine kinase [Proteobacteria bacterium]|nr:MAG: homoserine kinase [Pseudomonadota bacterium]
MAVYTKISDKDIILINKKFKLGKKIKFQGIKKGIENTNYLLKTEKGKFILTIFEKRVSSSDLPFFMKLMDLLSLKKIICPKPLKDNYGKYLFKIKNKKACIVSFLSGKDKNNLTYKNCFEVGKNIAKMHKATKNLKIKRSNSMGINKLHPLLNSINFKKSKLILSYKEFLFKNLKEIKKNWPKKLPSGIIHADLFVDNIFFKNNKFSGFIDFYFSANDYFAYELAICINALCFDKKKSKFIINKQKVNNLIKGYEKIRKISINEKNKLNILCKGAAIRYLLTRAYDYINTPKTALIKIKDPKEYYQKLIIHNKINSFKEYIH